MNLILLTSVDSTNNYLQELSEKGLAEEGTIVLSLEQSKGKGQRGSDWESKPGFGLYVSILLKPKDWAVEKQYILNKAVAVGVAWYIDSKTDKDVRIKWPNDILIAEKKVAGILIENVIRGEMVSSVVAGIGINLNQNDFTREFETPATSLKIVTGKNFDPETEAVELFREVWKAYCQIIAGESETMEEHYSHYLFKRGERALFIKGEGLFYGVLKSVDSSGAALIEENGRTIRATHPGTRFYLRDKRFRN